jgi:hypothetical protein
VISTDASFKKTWLLHCIQEPQIDGSTSLVIRNGKHFQRDVRYGGKLSVETLLPKEAVVTKVGGPGREFWIESAKRNFPTTKGGAAEAGAWRIEVSPKIPNRHDMFLHVLTAMDAEASVETKAGVLSQANLVGASLRKVAVFFSRDGQLLETAEINLDGPKETVLACDLKPGLWSAKKAGQVTRIRVNSQAKTLLLEGAEGLIRLEYLHP